MAPTGDETQRWALGSDHARCEVLACGGHLDRVAFGDRQAEITPMHRAPWVDDAAAQAAWGDDVPAVLRHLRGDFFCAPFGAADLPGEEAPPHGHTANGRWLLRSRSATSLDLELDARVCGATVRKRVEVADGSPTIVQIHRLEGGAGALPIGHHAMLAAPASDRLVLSFSARAWIGTPPHPVEPDPSRGRSKLRYPARFASLHDARLADGTTADLTIYPTLEDCEEIVLLADAPDQRYAWSAAVARAGGWAWFALRPHGPLRATLLWMSNGGRDYPPFSSRHRRVLGIEEITAAFHLGHSASLEAHPWHEAGMPTVVTLDPARPLEVRYAFGAVRVPPGFERVVGLDVGPDHLVLRGLDGLGVEVPFSAERLHIGASAIT